VRLGSGGFRLTGQVAADVAGDPRGGGLDGVSGEVRVPAVVWTWAWPSNLPIMVRLSPRARALLIPTFFLSCNHNKLMNAVMLG